MDSISSFSMILDGRGDLSAFFSLSPEHGRVFLFRQPKSVLGGGGLYEVLASRLVFGDNKNDLCDDSLRLSTV